MLPDHPLSRLLPYLAASVLVNLANMLGLPVSPVREHIRPGRMRVPCEASCRDVKKFSESSDQPFECLCSGLIPPDILKLETRCLAVPGIHPHFRSLTTFQVYFPDRLTEVARQTFDAVQ